jgi:hypothetical protein
MSNRLNYSASNFEDIRKELFNFVKQYYPDLKNTTDVTVASMLFDTMAGTADLLMTHTNRMAQELVIDYAQERSSVMSMARTFGLKIPHLRPSASICDFSVIIPVRGDAPDSSYYPKLLSGAQVSGAGKVFELLHTCDFSQPFTEGGIPNRTIIPNFNADNKIVNYTITKREMVVNGNTKIYSRVTTINDIRPFFTVILPENDVVSVESIVFLDGTSYVGAPPDNVFNDLDLKWYEVDALAQDTLFIPDGTINADNPSIKAGKYIRLTKGNKFITEYTDNGFMKIIFGAGTQDVTGLCNIDVSTPLVNMVGDFINNMALGAVPPANKTMFIKYRVGGGSNTNLGSNVLTSMGNHDITVTGNDTKINAAVMKSLTVNNPLPAIGGKDAPSVEEIRNLIKYNFSAQNRAVTLSDYKALIGRMPGKFGVPFRYNVVEEQNKIKIYTITLDGNSKISSSSTSTLQENIATYLSDYRMLNDYIEVNSGKVYNLGFEIDLFIDKGYQQAQVMAQVITLVTNYFDINKWGMGENIYMGQLLEAISGVKGVMNVIDLRVFNKVGQGRYSSYEVPQPYIDDITRQVDLLGDFVLYGDPVGMFEIKYPDRDIKVRVK